MLLSAIRKHPFDGTEAIRGRSLWQDARTRFSRNKAAMVSAYVLLFVALLALFGPLLSAWSNQDIDWGVLGNVREMGAPAFALTFSRMKLENSMPYFAIVASFSTGMIAAPTSL